MQPRRWERTPWDLVLEDQVLRQTIDRLTNRPELLLARLARHLLLNRNGRVPFQSQNAPKARRIDAIVVLPPTGCANTIPLIGMLTVPPVKAPVDTGGRRMFSAAPHAGHGLSSVLDIRLGAAWK